MNDYDRYYPWLQVPKYRLVEVADQLREIGMEVETENLPGITKWWLGGAIYLGYENENGTFMHVSYMEASEKLEYEPMSGLEFLRESFTTNRLPILKAMLEMIEAKKAQQ